MDIVKNLWDANLSEDQKFFAELIYEEFGCGSRIEKIKNKSFVNGYSRPMHDFNIYTTAMPNEEGIRMICWNQKNKRSGPKL